MNETTTLECNKHESQVDCNTICNSLDDYRKLASFSVSDLKSFVDTDDIWEFRVLNYSFEMEAVKHISCNHHTFYSQYCLSG